ncbi:hypothetical protein CEXT_279041 [Caerostris extrusa]|uniref:Uncharacterized protein n=1 Tax=Caerostris extrusa TaxID=172846 RepID=A0AAV4Y0Z4_CAEEX|nr:hypothetical protein CEXT_279041 [Caerostris extrusa]
MQHSCYRGRIFRAQKFAQLLHLFEANNSKNRTTPSRLRQFELILRLWCKWDLVYSYYTIVSLTALFFTQAWSENGEKMALVEGNQHIYIHGLLSQYNSRQPAATKTYYLCVSKYNP